MMKTPSLFMDECPALHLILSNIKISLKQALLLIASFLLQDVAVRINIVLFKNNINEKIKEIYFEK